jgi:probable HAF family extracellular repeat protein
MIRLSWCQGRALIAVVLTFAFGFAAQAQAEPYPYTLIDPGTFGGPSSFLDEPGIPLTGDGTLLGSADTATVDSGYLPPCGSGFCDGFQQHAFAWRDGTLTDLGVLPGTTGSSIDQINGHGFGAGVAETALSLNPGGIAVLFAHGQVISLGTLPGGSQSFAQNINDQGQVAGNSSNGIPDPFSIFNWGTETRSFVWRGGVMRDLGSLGGPDTMMSWQNARGEIVGTSYTNDTPNPANNGFPSEAPFLWQHGHMINLGSLGGSLGAANLINDAGQVVGLSNLAGDQNAHPFLWQNGKMIDFGTPDGNFGDAVYINQHGDSTGNYIAADGNFHGILWRGHQMIDLPPVGGVPSAFGNALNNHDQVVGFESDANGNEVIAVLWTGGHGYNLNTLAEPSDFQMTSADYIDNQGDIVGHGFMADGSQRMFLLVRNPAVPLPATSTSATTPSKTGPQTLRTAGALAPRLTGPTSSASLINRWLLLDRMR